MRNIDFIAPDNTHIHACFCKIADEYRNVDCENTNCGDCVIETAEWLLEERIVDWTKVKPFTLVKVRDSNAESWYSGYYFVRMIVIESKECFIVSTTDDVDEPGEKLLVYNQCTLY